MPITTISQKGQIVIPKELRRRHGMPPGSKVLVIELDDHVAVMPLPEGPIKASRGMLKTEKSVGQVLKAYKDEEKRLEQEHHRRMP